MEEMQEHVENGGLMADGGHRFPVGEANLSHHGSGMSTMIQRYGIAVTVPRTLLEKRLGHPHMRDLRDPGKHYPIRPNPTTRTLCG